MGHLRRNPNIRGWSAMPPILTVMTDVTGPQPLAKNLSNVTPAGQHVGNVIVRDKQ